MKNKFKKIKVKICCIKSKKEAQIAYKYGASSIGLVSKMPSGPGIISDSLINKIVNSSPTGLETTLLTCYTSPNKIINQHKKAKTNNIQLVKKIDINNYGLIKKALPYTKLIQVIHITDKDIIKNAIKISKHVDYLLLDTGSFINKEKLGGTGKVHDWNISKIIRNSVKIPIILAGGLNHRNVNTAIEKVMPFGVDVCSGVRTNDKLDLFKLKEFFNSLSLKNPLIKS